LQRRRFLITGGDGDGAQLPNYDQSLPKYDDDGAAAGSSMPGAGAAVTPGAAPAPAPAQAPSTPTPASAPAGAQPAGSDSSGAQPAVPAAASAASGTAVPAPLGGPDDGTVPGQQYVPPPQRTGLPIIRLK
jgi:phospholipid-binding lipoprotein MlaA